mgnify:FL=1
MNEPEDRRANHHAFYRALATGLLAGILFTPGFGAVVFFGVLLWRVK